MIGVGGAPAMTIGRTFVIESEELLTLISAWYVPVVVGLPLIFPTLAATPFTLPSLIVSVSPGGRPTAEKLVGEPVAQMLVETGRSIKPLRDVASKFSFAGAGRVGGCAGRIT